MYPRVCYAPAKDYASSKGDRVSNVLDIVEDNRVRRAARAVGADQRVANDTRRVDDSQ